jgi:hypothetical protein
MNHECAREQDVLDAVATGRWPDRVDADLRAHAAGCAVCRDTADISALFFADRDAAWQEADLPAASCVWWRAQLRARREAAEQAARPMVLVERAALAYAGIVLFGVGVLLGPWLRAWGRAAGRFVEGVALTQDGVTAVATNVGVVPIALAALVLLLAPFVLVYAVSDR